MASQKRQISAHPAGRALAWFGGSLQLLRAQPLRLLLIGLVLQFFAGLTQVAILGVIFVLLVPAFTAGVLQAFHVTASGFRPPLAMLFVAFGRTDRLFRLVLLGGLMLGVAMLAVTVAASGALQGIDTDTMRRLEQGDVNALLALDPALLERLMLALVAGLLVSGTLSFYAIPLIWFFGRPLGSAVVDGILGMLRNWKPLLLMGLLVSVLAVPLALFSVLSLTTQAGAPAMAPLFSLLTLLAAVVLQLVVFATQFLSFREIFDLSPVEPAERGDGDQLVA